MPVLQDKELSLDGLSSIILKTSILNGADIPAVLYAMVEEAVSLLSDGRIIRLGDLGSLRISTAPKEKRQWK